MPSENTGLSNSVYNLLSASGRDAKFLYQTIDTYIKDAEKDNRSDLVDFWKSVKQERQEHLNEYVEKLKNEFKQY
ncbi:MAG TPA: hypothetical protein VFV86_00665 [Nitrososphaeraceae archaeon]|nr:hypothetical protein [Nitrososphaeraceae archaeon]